MHNKPWSQIRCTVVIDSGDYCHGFLCKFNKIFCVRSFAISQCQLSASFNLLAPERCGDNLKSVICERILLIKFTSNSCEITPRWLSQNAFDDKSTLFDAVAWCHHATRVNIHFFQFKKTLLAHEAWNYTNRHNIWYRTISSTKRFQRHKSLEWQW